MLHVNEPQIYVEWKKPYMKDYILKEDGQDGRIGRPWAYPVLGAHQKYNYLQDTYWWEWSED